jgi:hypothetical protein
MQMAGRMGLVGLLIGANLLVPYQACLSADCPSEDQWIPTVSLASAALQEIRASKSTAETASLAVAVFIRSYTCNLLASDPDLLAASLAALEAECTKVLPLQSSDESGRNREIYRLMDATQPDFVALVWETHENGKIRHTAIASNGMMAVRFDWPGYGHANDQDISPHECETSPWTF